MTLPLIVTAALAAFAYLAAVRQAARGAAQPLWVAIALVAHAATLLIEIKTTQQLSLATAVSLVAWQTALLLAGLWRVSALWPLRLWVFALAAIASGMGALPSSHAAATPTHWKIALHAALAIFAAGLLTLAALQAVAIQLLTRVLHRPDQLTRALKLPSLQASEDWLFQLIGAGFFVLSLALLSGLVFVDNLFAQHLVHKTVLSMIAWAIFGLLLAGKYRWGWRGKRATRLALAGYAVLVLAYFGSKLVLEQLLGRHW